MATVAQTKLLTAEEFMAADLGEGTFELVRGEIVEVPPAMPEHGVVCANVCWSSLGPTAASRATDTHCPTTRPS